MGEQPVDVDVALDALEETGANGSGLPTGVETICVVKSCRLKNPGSESIVPLKLTD